MKLPRLFTKHCVSVAVFGSVHAGFESARQRGKKSREG